ncbi:MAG TPA: TIM-barrel domain-containing protein [Burkholderiaceae bacterium]|nr:TIM-barrel domain-containing protein [Burkholderiaceae bacterium]
MKFRLALLLLAMPLVQAADDGGAHGRYLRTPTGLLVTPASGPARQVRLEVIDARIIHVVAAPGDSADVPASLMVTAHADPAVPFEIDAHGAHVVLRTSAVSADVDLDSGLVAFADARGRTVLAERDRAAFEPVTVDGHRYVAVRQLFNPGTDEAFYGLGQHQNAELDLNGRDVELAQHNMDVAVPFVLSSRNYGVLWDNNSITRFGNPRPYGLASRDLKLLDARGRPGGLTARYFLGGKLAVERVEPDIDYQYFRDLPRRPPEVLADSISNTSALPTDRKDETVTWEGSLVTGRSGVHTFRLFASSYFKLYADGRLVLDGWRQNWNAWYHNFELPMRAGTPVKLRVEWVPSDGQIALLHNDPLPDAERHALALASELGHAVDYYFVGGDDLDGVIAGYRRLTGKAVLLPRWAYGFWQSRQRYKDQGEILDVLHQYRSRHLPLDNVVEDWFYWREDDWGSHRFDPARFPDPQGMIDALHAGGAHFMISVWPKFYTTTDNYRELDARGFIYRRNVELGVHDWVGQTGYLNSIYDPYSPAARELYWRRIHERLGVLGVDAWWLDASEPDIHSNVDIDELKRRIGPTAMGPGAAYFNSYPLLHTQGVYEGARRDTPDRRVMILTRSGFAGLQRHAAAVWSGDTASRWADLRNQVAAGLGLSMAGIPNWSFDIGGFTMEARYQQPDAAALDEWRELNLRWFQFGAFVPLMRSHGEAPYREIYSLAPEGSEVYEALAWYDRLRYRLLPYIYTLAADTWHRDGSILRALPMDFPGDPRVRDLNDEYLFGHAFLVAPVHEYKARTRPVYLPAGARWIDFQTGAYHEGGERIEAAAPLARMPLFVRAGSLVPTGPAIEHTDQGREGPLTLLVFTGANGHFELYDDDGTSYGYERGEWSRIPFDWDDASGTLHVGARQGAFPGMPAHLPLRVRFIAPGSAVPAQLDAPPDRELDYDGSALDVRRGA